MEEQNDFPRATPLPLSGFSIISSSRREDIRDLAASKVKDRMNYEIARDSLGTKGLSGTACLLISSSESPEATFD